jgi:hypothetical protein
MLYPATPLVSVEAVHARVICWKLLAVALSEPGVVGAVVSTTLSCRYFL